MFVLAEHKVHEIAGSNLIVLPKRWVQNQQICKGDKVTCLLNEDGDLVIRKNIARKSLLTKEGRKAKRKSDVYWKPQ